MNTKTTYYPSPIGILQIKTSADELMELLFSKNTNEPATGIQNTTLSVIEKNCIQQLDEYFNGTRKQFDLPLQFNGTVFQQSVWTALLAIPYGATTSYHQLSKRLGNTKAIRAVGTANGKNPLAIIVPCHRVIGSNGDLVGYAGELWRKKWLLQHEAKWENGVQTLF